MKTWGIVAVADPQFLLGGELADLGLARRQAQNWADARQESLLVVELPEHDYRIARSALAIPWKTQGGERFDPRPLT